MPDPGPTRHRQSGAKRRLALGATAGLIVFFWAGQGRAVDAEFGRYLATECLTCHRSATSKTGAIPNIFGMAESTFTVVVKAYRAKELPNPVMQTIASRLKDDEIDALAAYFARTKQP
jgi:cytochrome c